MLALMAFVTSPLNDLGDMKGDREAGGRTIPIVLGKKNTYSSDGTVQLIIWL
jgi:geranylgeranylglycerol-phosphate geranylgeranyltransferase